MRGDRARHHPQGTSADGNVGDQIQSSVTIAEADLQQQLIARFSSS